jgi:hypothetical protein
MELEVLLQSQIEEETLSLQEGDEEYQEEDNGRKYSS